ncbi:MAG: cellulase-like family protein [Parafilimonas sp.]
MNRKEFIQNTSLASATIVFNKQVLPVVSSISKKIQPLAITMWDFSWLERLWSGAGYEDWDKILDELVLRGYNAIRIDAYPHLVANDAAKEYTLLPVWDVQDWGSPAINKVIVQPALNQFIAKCKKRNVMVGMSCWYRQDTDKVLMKINSPEKMAENWITTLTMIEKDGLLDAILYVDLCNEWPGDLWCPFFTNDPPDETWDYWFTPKSMQFMQASIAMVRKAYPQLPLCYSLAADGASYPQYDLSFFDLIEHHLWMAQMNKDEYYKAVGYHYERFSPDGYNHLVANYEKVYNDRPDYWRRLLVEGINTVATSAKTINKPLITTECWGLVDFKDWPLLKWDIIKELCELGVQTAASTGQWIAIATSNFCGPQFVGMWQDVAWHQRLTSVIKQSTINQSVQQSLIAKRLAMF